MPRRGFQIVVIVVLLFAALPPLVETLDTWDRPPIPSSDTELRVATLAVGVGIVLLLSKLLRSILLFKSVESVFAAVISASCSGSFVARACGTNESPPIQPLRI